MGREERSKSMRSGVLAFVGAVGTVEVGWPEVGELGLVGTSWVGFCLETNLPLKSRHFPRHQVHL